MAALTYVKDGKLFEVSEGVDQCLHALAPWQVGRPVWAPDGTRVMLNPSQMLDSAGFVSDTGYLAENGGARWSMPTGKSIIAPSVRNGSLLKRLAGNVGSRQDISFLMPTESVAYHPAGKHIFASGIGPEGAGLYIASNTGLNPRMIASLTDPATHITEIVAPPAGDNVVFIHDHGGMAHVHRLTLPDLTLFDLVTVETDLSHLVVMADNSVAVRTGSCDGPGGSVLVARPDGSTVDLSQTLPGQSLIPVGELSGHLLVEARAQGGCAGPADIVVIDPANPTDHTVVRTGVDFGAVRTSTPTVGELPGEIDAQAPG